jgi:hypothetical protein
LRKDISGDSAFLAQHKVAILHIILLNDILGNLFVEEVPVEEALCQLPHSQLAALHKL